MNKFPQVRIRGYDQGHGARTLGAINPTEINWKSTSANATLSRVAGAHTFKFGGDWRKMGIDTYIPGDGAGFFEFDKDMTSSDGGIGSTTNGNAFASFLLGYPSARTDRTTFLSVSTPLNVFTHYFGGYAQDDWRINSKVTLTYGLRLEHEKGLSEKDNNFTVGFDPLEDHPVDGRDSRRSDCRDGGADRSGRPDVRGYGRQQDIPRQCAGREVVAAGWRLTWRTIAPSLVADTASIGRRSTI